MLKLDSARALCETIATLHHGNPEAPPGPDQIAGSLYGIGLLIENAFNLLRKTGGDTAVVCDQLAS
jgi:hypothetical protein